MPRLRILTMRNNRVTSLPESTFRNLRSNIAVLDLDGNPLECTCNMMWYRSWLQEGDAQFPGPRCGNGKMLRDLPLSRSDCEVYERNSQLNMPLTNEHGDLFARQSLDESGPCDSEPFEELKSGLPPPEESEYFDQSVDYPSTNDTAELESNERRPPPPPQSPFNDQEPNVGKNFNHSNTILNLNQAPRPHHPQEQPFSIFGIPIPSFGQLFGQGRHTNGRATSFRGRGRVQLYRNDDPELLKLLNKNQVRVGVGGARPSEASHPNDLQNRPLFQTPFQEPTVQKGGFTPILPGEAGFQPMGNGTKTEVIETRNETATTEGDSDEKTFQQVITISNKNDLFNGSKENFQVDLQTENLNEQNIELGQSIDLPDNEIPPREEAASSQDQDATSADAEIPLKTMPDTVELDYYDRELERQKTNEKPSWEENNKDPDRNELLSALVAPGAQQGIYRNPPGRSSITKVFTPSPAQSTTNAAVVPSPEEYYRADPQLPYSSTEVHPERSRVDSFSSRASSPDWYFESYNKTDPPKMYPKRSYPSVQSGSNSLTATSVIMLTILGLFVT